MKTLSIVLGDKCNLRCSFCLCLDSLNKGNSLSQEDIFRFIDWQLALHPEENFRVEFFGGEPLIYWDKILKTYERYKGRVTWTVFTNGVFPGYVDRDLLLEMFDEIILSIEGPRDLSLDRHPSDKTYNKALDNLRYMVEKAPTKVGVGFVLLPDTDIDRVFRFFKSLGVRYYNFEIVTHLNNDRSSGIDNKTIYKFLRYIYYNVVLEGYCFTIPRELISSENYFSIFSRETHSCFKNFRAIAPSGNIYFCRDLAANEDKVTKQSNIIYRDGRVPFNIKDLQLNPDDTFDGSLARYESYISCPVKSFESYHLIGYGMSWIKDKDFQDLVIKPMFYFSYQLFDCFFKGTPPPDFGLYQHVIDHYDKVFEC